MSATRPRELSPFEFDRLQYHRTRRSPELSLVRVARFALRRN